MPAIRNERPKTASPSRGGTTGSRRTAAREDQQAEDREHDARRAGDDLDAGLDRARQPARGGRTRSARPRSRRRAARRSRSPITSAAACRASGSRKPPDLRLVEVGRSGASISRLGLQLLRALDSHVEDDRRGRSRQREAGGPAAARGRCGRRAASGGAVASARASPGGGAAGGAAVRAHADPRTAQRPARRPSRRATGQRWRRAAPPRTRRASGRTARPRGPRRSRRSSAASGRDGSKKKVMPSSGLGAKLDRARDHREHDRLAERAGGREHGRRRRSPAARRARAIVHITRQRLTPSAAAPSVHERGTARSASTMIAIMIGMIITVRISAATSRLAPSSWTRRRPIPCARADQVVADEGTSTRIPISP